MSPLLDVEHLSVEIPLTHGLLRPVRDVSFSVEPGETLCIVGESGCGKSLTALAIMGLLPRRARRSAARLKFEELELGAIPERAMMDIRGNGIAMIFQDPMTSLNPSFTIGNQLEEVLVRHRGASRAEARDRALFLLEKVGISAPHLRLKQYPHQLSGGLRQRVMIAMALMCNPKLLIADEPTTALDVTIQVQILHLLNDLCDEFGMGLLLITHDLGIVSRIADRVAVMYAGEIVELGKSSEVMLNPIHPYTEALLKCIPVPGKVERGQYLGSIPGVVPSLAEEISGCVFRERCAYAMPQCAEDVNLSELSADHVVRCVLWQSRGARQAMGGRQ
ncbi:MAG: ABC transporter ATP-binding protein [Rhizobiaceae bacterium]|nr:ABC transporter ATP-binding protein [Rhizobiaceae bacterium]